MFEASPTDRIWGIGMAETHADARIPSRWQGKNLPGFALMKVCDVLRDQRGKGRGAHVGCARPSLLPVLWRGVDAGRAYLTRADGAYAQNRSL